MVWTIKKIYRTFTALIRIVACTQQMLSALACIISPMSLIDLVIGDPLNTVYTASASAKIRLNGAAKVHIAPSRSRLAILMVNIMMTSTAC